MTHPVQEEAVWVCPEFPVSQIVPLPPTQGDCMESLWILQRRNSLVLFYVLCRHYSLIFHCSGVYNDEITRLSPSSSFQNTNMSSKSECRSSRWNYTKYEIVHWCLELPWVSRFRFVKELKEPKSEPASCLLGVPRPFRLRHWASTRGEIPTLRRPSIPGLPGRRIVGVSHCIVKCYLMQ